MGRDRVQIKRRPRDLTKKLRVPCNFCEFSSIRYGCISEETLHEEAVLQKEVEKLRLLIKRMTGKDECTSFTELEALISHLRDVQCIVQNQRVILDWIGMIMWY